MKKFTQYASAFLGFLLISTSANAVIDLAAVSTGFDDLTTAITTVGGLILTAAVTAVVYKWIKGMIFS